MCIKIPGSCDQGFFYKKLHGGNMKKDKVKKLAEQITKTLFGRMFLVGLALILQFGWILLTVMTLDNKYPIVSILIQLASVLAVLWIVSKNINPAYKLAWTILILAMPVAGTSDLFSVWQIPLGTESEWPFYGRVCKYGAASDGGAADKGAAGGGQRRCGHTVALHSGSGGIPSLPEDPDPLFSCRSGAL